MRTGEKTVFTISSQDGYLQITGTSTGTDMLAAMEVLGAGGIEIRPDDLVVTADGEPLELTVREFQLLTELARRHGRIVTRDELYMSVWKRPFRAAERSVDVYVKRLRRKLDEVAPGWVFIHTHYGFGYRFSPQPKRVSQVFHTPATDR